jgi:pyruvate dehydrogenase E1 component alpha subunit
MQLIRRFEEKAGQLYGMGLIGGFCHLYIGQEAVVTGIEQSITRKDSVITTYRDHGHMLACDMDAKGVMAELTGRIGGYSKGKGGSMHMFSVENNFWGGHGIVGASVPIGAGLAFAHKYRGTNNICVCYYGDGAANQGQVYEAYNMAALWGLPVLFVIENNGYAMGTSVKRSHAATDLYRAGESLGVQGEQVNGMDVIEVMEKSRLAVERVRKGEPYILEMKTYRYRGHSMSDPAKYRSKEEVDHYKEQLDCIETLKNRALQAKLISEDEFKKMDAEIKDIVNESAEFAKESPEPDASGLWTDITQ